MLCVGRSNNHLATDSLRSLVIAQPLDVKIVLMPKTDVSGLWARIKRLHNALRSPDAVPPSGSMSTDEKNKRIEKISLSDICSDSVTSKPSVIRQYMHTSLCRCDTNKALYLK